MNSIKRLLPYLAPHKTRFLQASVIMVCVALVNGLSVWLLKPAVDFVFINADIKKLKLLVAAIPLVFLLKMVLQYTQSYLMSWLGQRITQRIREDLFRHMHELSMDFFWKRKSGEILSRLTNDLGNLASGLHFVPLYLVRDSLTVVVLVCVMFYIYWQFALIAIIAIPLAAMVLAVLGRKLRSASRQSQEIMGEIYHRFQESLQGMLVVKAFNYEAGAIRKFNRENDLFFEQMMRYFRATALSGPLMEFLGSLLLACIIYQAGWAIFRKRMTTGDFFTFLGSFFAAYQPIKNLSQLNSTLQMALAGADRIFNILEETPTVRESPRPVLFKSLRQGITLENVSFKYPERDAWALRNVDLHIKPGEILGVAGPSGSGKTTLVHLLLRLFDPTEGRILLDGTDLREFSLSSVRAHVGLVTQDTVLFNDTVYGNIALSKPGAPTEQVRSALEVADASAFVDAMPEGGETQLGDRGLRLSGGQRQRLAIARAVIKEPAILVLDEATSNLDSASEKGVQQALERIYKGRTVVLIAHRLSTLQNADRIAVFHRGELVESGRHAALVAKGGVYATLFKFQQLGAEALEPAASPAPAAPDEPAADGAVVQQ
ncbi:MAG: ABC transporter ATP-binding protein [Elusimicrobia bacterium]|nr:ABC transporter ATP-binding protein [Elusimicrobiota bacterium]